MQNDPITFQLSHKSGVRRQHGLSNLSFHPVSADWKNGHVKKYTKTTNERTDGRTNERTHRPTNKQTNKQTNKLSFWMVSLQTSNLWT